MILHTFLEKNNSRSYYFDKVKGTKADHSHWSEENLFACGTANYEGTKYSFMFLYSARTIWFALNETPYESYVPGGAIWPGGLRAYQLHSKIPDETFPFDPKIIHVEE